MKKINISVTELGIPSPKVGSIDTYSGFALTSKLAVKAHQKFQLQQVKEHVNYCPEVAVGYTIKYKRYHFVISGRMDGIYQSDEVRIEEIKTAFEPQKLIESLADNYFTHPYWLQLQLYGYIHWLRTSTLPQMNLLILSLRNKKTQTLPITLDIKQFTQWLETRFDELIQELKASERRIIHRKKQSKQLTFPFEPRLQQQDLMKCVTQGMHQNQPMLIQAPTGLGKTLGILYPVLQESLNRGQKTIYVTPKNTQHLVASNAMKLLQNKGSSCKSLVLTSKKKLCMKNEPLCSSKHCEFAEHHYTKVTQHALKQKAQKKTNLDAAFFKAIATQYQVCPYELQMECISFVDVVIGDYNYVFSAANSNTRVVSVPLGEVGKPNLVIDEVHNLPQRGMGYFSPILEVAFFERLLNTLNRYPHVLHAPFEKLLTQCIQIVHDCALPGVRQPHLVQVEHSRFAKQEEQLNQFLSEYLELDVPIESNDVVLQLCRYWSDFTEALEIVVEGRDEFFISFNPLGNFLKISCCDASSFLQENYNNFQQVVGFSATLKPFLYYSQLMGLNPNTILTREFSSPFNPEHRKLLLIPQVSTKYKDRNQNYAKIVEVLVRVTSLNPGNYLIFFPSFHFLEHVFSLMPKSTDFILLKQERTMHSQEIKDFFAKIQRKERNHLVFAVQGGIFAEGIDYIGELAIGAFVVGPPLPNYDWEREQMKHYYERHYQAGNEYAYIYPAMAKSIQAAGRVIRTEKDKGLIVFLDNRFLNATYSQCMPQDWFYQSPQELVSQAILKEVSCFWETALISEEDV